MSVSGSTNLQTSSKKEVDTAVFDGLDSISPDIDEAVVEEHPPDQHSFVRRPSLLFAVEDELTAAYGNNDGDDIDNDHVDGDGQHAAGNKKDEWANVNAEDGSTNNKTSDSKASSSLSPSSSSSSKRTIHSTQTYTKIPFVAGKHAPYLYPSSLLCESIYRAQHSREESLSFIADTCPALASSHTISYHSCKYNLVTSLQALHEQSKTAYLVIPGTRLMTSNLWKLATDEESQSRLKHDIATNCKLDGVHIDHILNTQLEEKQLQEIQFETSSTTIHANGSIHNGFFHRALSIDITTMIQKWHEGWTIVFVGHSSGGSVAHLLVLRMMREILHHNKSSSPSSNTIVNDDGSIDIIDDDHVSVLNDRVLSIAFGAPFFGDSLFCEYARRIGLSSLFLTILTNHDVMSCLLDYDKDHENPILNSLSRPIRDWMLKNLGVDDKHIGLKFQPCGKYVIEQEEEEEQQQEEKVEKEIEQTKESDGESQVADKNEDRTSDTHVDENLTSENSSLSSTSTSSSPSSVPSSSSTTSSSSSSSLPSSSSSSSSSSSTLPLFHAHEFHDAANIRYRLRSFSFTPWHAKRAHEMKLYMNYMKGWESHVLYETTPNNGDVLATQTAV